MYFSLAHNCCQMQIKVILNFVIYPKSVNSCQGQRVVLLQLKCIIFLLSALVSFSIALSHTQIKILQLNLPRNNNHHRQSFHFSRVSHFRSCAGLKPYTDCPIQCTFCGSSKSKQGKISVLMVLKVQCVHFNFQLQNVLIKILNMVYYINFI